MKTGKRLRIRAAAGLLALVLGVGLAGPAVGAAERGGPGREEAYASGLDAAVRPIPEKEECSCAYRCAWFWGDYVQVNGDCPRCGQASEEELDYGTFDPDRPEDFVCQGVLPILPGNDPDCRHSGSQIESWFPGLEGPELAPASCKYPASAAPPIQCWGCGARWLWKLDGNSRPDPEAHLWNESVPDRIVAPTCTQEGAVLHACQLCGAEKSSPIPALGHSWDGLICTVCGAREFETNKVPYDPALSAPDPSLRRVLPDTTEGLSVSAAYGEGVCVITCTIPEEFRGDTVQVNATEAVNDAFARLGSDAEGRAGPVFLRMVNRSSQNFSYEEGSFILQSPDHSAKTPAGDPVYAFDGTVLAEEFIPQRARSGALEYLFGVEKGALDGEQLTDEAVGEKLVERGYENAVSDLHRFYLDYYNNFYSGQFDGALWSSLSQVPGELLVRRGEGIFGASGGAVRESNPEVAGLGYSHLYTHLLRVIPGSGGPEDGETGFTVGEYMRGRNAFDGEAGALWGELAAGESSGTLSGMTLSVDGGPNDFYQDAQRRVEVAFSLRARGGEPSDAPGGFEEPGQPEMGSLTIVKSVSGGGGEIRDYTFDVAGPGNYEETVTVTGPGQVRLEELEPGAYFVTERNAALEGYRWSVSGEGVVQVEAGVRAQCTIQNTYVSDGSKPEEPGPRPEEPGPRPEEPGVKPEEPGPKPEEPGPKPEEPGAKPEEPGPKPEEPGAKPEEPGAKPEEPGPKPEEPGPRPEEPGAKPEEPGISLEEVLPPLSEAPGEESRPGGGVEALPTEKSPSQSGPLETERSPNGGEETPSSPSLPRSDVPRTGDSSWMGCAAALLSVLVLAAVRIGSRPPRKRR